MENKFDMQNAKCTDETAKAICVKWDDGVNWVPKSVIHDDSEVWKKGQGGVCLVEEWWAEKNGLL